MLADRISLPLDSLDGADTGGGSEIALLNPLEDASPAGSDPGSGAPAGLSDIATGLDARARAEPTGETRDARTPECAPPFGITRGRKWMFGDSMQV
jgi:hypothetical protein